MHGSQENLLSSVVDVRLNFDAIRTGDTAASEDPRPIPADLQVRSKSEVASFFTLAWELATAAFPLAVTADPPGLAPAGAPRVELHIINEHPDQSGLPHPLRTLDMVDLSDYGRPRQLSRLDNLSAGITTPLDLPEAKIAEVVNEAMTRMTEDAGFTGGATPPCTR